MDKVSLGQASYKDFQDIKELFLACGWDWLEPDSEMHKALGVSSLYKAEFSGLLIGFGRIITDGKIYGLLVDLMVHPSFRRKGVGLQLTNHIVQESQKAGIKIIQLLASKQGRHVYEMAEFTSCPPESPGMIKFLKARKVEL